MKIMHQLKPLWRYNNEDITTWKYKTYRIVKKGKTSKLEWINNPKFEYSHLEDPQSAKMWKCDHKFIHFGTCEFEGKNKKRKSYIIKKCTKCEMIVEKNKLTNEELCRYGNNVI